MPTSDPLDILLAHDRWATGQILSACAKLTPEQFHQRFEMGPGSLHDTATHILAAMRIWGDVLAGREQRPRLEGTKRTQAELLNMLEEIAADLAAAARSHPLDQTVSRVREGKTYVFTRGAVLAPRHNPRHASPRPVPQHAPASGREGAPAEFGGGMGQNDRFPEIEFC